MAGTPRTPRKAASRAYLGSLEILGFSAFWRTADSCFHCFSDFAPNALPKASPQPAASRSSSHSVLSSTGGSSLRSASFSGSSPASRCRLHDATQRFLGRPNEYRPFARGAHVPPDRGRTRARPRHLVG